MGAADRQKRDPQPPKRYADDFAEPPKPPKRGPATKKTTSKKGPAMKSSAKKASAKKALSKGRKHARADSDDDDNNDDDNEEPTPLPPKKSRKTKKSAPTSVPADAVQDDVDPDDPYGGRGPSPPPRWPDAQRVSEEPRRPEGEIDAPPPEAGRAPAGSPTGEAETDAPAEAGRAPAASPTEAPVASEDATEEQDPAADPGTAPDQHATNGEDAAAPEDANAKGYESSEPSSSPASSPFHPDAQGTPEQLTTADPASTRQSDRPAADGPASSTIGSDLPPTTEHSEPHGPATTIATPPGGRAGSTGTNRSSRSRSSIHSPTYSRDPDQTTILGGPSQAGRTRTPSRTSAGQGDTTQAGSPHSAAGPPSSPPVFDNTLPAASSPTRNRPGSSGSPRRPTYVAPPAFMRPSGNEGPSSDDAGSLLGGQHRTATDRNAATTPGHTGDAPSDAREETPAEEPAQQSSQIQVFKRPGMNRGGNQHASRQRSANVTAETPAAPTTNASQDPPPPASGPEVIRTPQRLRPPPNADDDYSAIVGDTTIGGDTVHDTANDTPIVQEQHEEGDEEEEGDDEPRGILAPGEREWFDHEDDDQADVAMERGDIGRGSWR